MDGHMAVLSLAYRQLSDNESQDLGQTTDSHLWPLVGVGLVAGITIKWASASHDCVMISPFMDSVRCCGTISILFSLLCSSMSPPPPQPTAHPRASASTSKPATCWG